MLKQYPLVKIFIITMICCVLVSGVTTTVVSTYYNDVVLPKKMEGILQNQEKSEVKQIVASAEEEQIISVVKNASASVVSVIVEKELSRFYQQTGPDPFSEWGFPFFQPPVQKKQTPPSGKQTIGGGTGFIIREDGLILTNKHVVLDEDATYTVLTSDGKKYEATVLARDPLKDIGVLKIEASGLPVLKLGDSELLNIGQTVIAIGNALAEFQNTVTKGVISGLKRHLVAGDVRGSSEVIEQAIQTDAAINPGNSGGPLLNLAGEVVGINTAIYQNGQSVGFAIPINEAKNVVTSIDKYGKIVRPFLGVRYVMLNESIAKANNLDVTSGALIVRGDNRTDLAVMPGSPADKAGIQENDIILEISGEVLNENRSLASALSQYMPGDDITLKIWHKGDIKEVKTTLTELTSQ